MGKNRFMERWGLALLFGEPIWKRTELWLIIRIGGSCLRTHLFLERETETAIPFRTVQQSPQMGAGPHCLALQCKAGCEGLGGGGVMVTVPLLPGAPPCPSSLPSSSPLALLSGLAHSGCDVGHISSLLNLESFLDGSVLSLTFYALYRTDVSSCYKLWKVSEILTVFL